MRRSIVHGAWDDDVMTHPAGTPACGALDSLLVGRYDRVTEMPPPTVARVRVAVPNSTSPDTDATPTPAKPTVPCTLVRCRSTRSRCGPKVRPPEVAFQM